MTAMSKDMTNTEIARLLRQLAAVFENQDAGFFRARAYENAASSIENLSVSLHTLWEQEKLNQVPGLGEKLRKYLDELFTTGRVEHFLNITKAYPPGMFVLLDVPGIGPKTAYKLAKTFHLHNEATAIEELTKAAKAGKIRELPDFGEKSEAEILKTLQQLTPKENRMLLPTAQNLAEEVLAHIRQHPAVQDAQALGSLRRKAATIGDVDIAVATESPQVFMDYLLTFPHIKKVLSTGEKTTMFLHITGREIDVKTQNPQEWGSILQHYTGSKLHNIDLRTYAQKQDWSLSEYGIKKNKCTETFTNEEVFYKALNMDYIPPELREGTGEIEAALHHQLPNLVKLTEIKGDLHLHTNIDIQTSHDLGQNSVLEILQKAESLGYEYVGLSDHNPKVSDLSLQQRRDAIKFRNDKINQGFEDYKNQGGKIVRHVLKGLEVDIKPDGSLALDDQSLALLDYAIVSMHSQFDQDRDTATKRAITALSHPKAMIFGHPTGRMLLQREGLTYDWEQLFELCLKKHKVLEINASPYRLDLPDSLVKQAVNYGIKLVINSDGHAVDQMDTMQYGIWTARRGWAEKKDVINTFSLKQLLAIWQ